jgi:hypothetical protein
LCSVLFVVVCVRRCDVLTGSVYLLFCWFLFCFQEDEAGGGSIRILVVVNLKSIFSRFKIQLLYVLIHLCGLARCCSKEFGA